VAHVEKVVAAKPSLVQISTACGGQKEGRPVLPRNKYTAIRDDKPQKKKMPSAQSSRCAGSPPTQSSRREVTSALLTRCARIPNAQSTTFKAEQEKRRREEAIAQVTGLRALKATSDAVPVRLMKRDLLFVAERLIFIANARSPTL
jgi:ParB family chromosome partitioning protein